jgi:uncharacterized membrane protein
MTVGTDIGHWARDNFRRFVSLAGTDTAPAPAAARLPAPIWAVAIAATGLLAVLLVLTGVNPAIRAPVVLAFLMLAPGWAIVRLIDVPDAAMRISLTFALSISIVGLITLVQAYASWWDPEAMVVVAAAITVLTALVEIVRNRYGGGE